MEGYSLITWLASHQLLPSIGQFTRICYSAKYTFLAPELIELWNVWCLYYDVWSNRYNGSRKVEIGNNWVGPSHLTSPSPSPGSRDKRNYTQNSYSRYQASEVRYQVRKVRYHIRKVRYQVKKGEISDDDIHWDRSVLWNRVGSV